MGRNLGKKSLVSWVNRIFFSFATTLHCLDGGLEILRIFKSAALSVVDAEASLENRHARIQRLSNINDKYI